MLQRKKILLAAAFFCVTPFNNIPVFAEAVELKGAGRAAQALMASKRKNNPYSSVAQTSAQPAKQQLDNREAQKPVAENAQKAQQIVSEGDCDGKSVEQIDLCDVSGTVCEDCGEIILAGGVLPEFAEVGGTVGDFSISPLFALAGIPLGLLAILGRSNDNNNPSSLPLTSLAPTNVPPVIINPVIPEQPAAPVPEPLSLLLFGAGLSAIATVTRRRRRSRLDSANADAAEVVVGE